MDNNIPQHEWLAIVNPNAGKGKGKQDWNKISFLLSKYEITYSVVFTERRLHATELTIEGISNGYRKILAIGGDGTMNEVVNGAFKQTICSPSEIVLGMIPVGTGNDWGKMFGIVNDYEEAVKIIKDYKIFYHDTGQLTFKNNGSTESRYFLNIAGLGFDANVASRTNAAKDRGQSGKAIYMYSLLKSLLGYHYTRTDIDIDGQKIVSNTFTMSIGIGRYSGGGMRQTPNAIPDDGLFDITVIGNMSKPSIVMNLKKLYDGTILELPLIKGYRGKTIKVESDPVIYVEADGESLGHSPVEFKIMHKSIGVVYGRLTIPQS